MMTWIIFSLKQKKIYSGKWKAFKKKNIWTKIYFFSLQNKDFEEWMSDVHQSLLELICDLLVSDNAVLTDFLDRLSIETLDHINVNLIVLRIMMRGTKGRYIKLPFPFLWKTSGDLIFKRVFPSFLQSCSKKCVYKNQGQTFDVWRRDSGFDSIQCWTNQGWHVVVTQINLLFFVIVFLKWADIETKLK